MVRVISGILVAIDEVADFLRGGSSHKKILAGQLSPSLPGTDLDSSPRLAENEIRESDKKIHARKVSPSVGPVL